MHITRQLFGISEQFKLVGPLTTWKENMGEVTSISWCDHTFNPWVGCSKVHTGCAHCYAEADMDKRRHFAQWGPNGTRVKTSEANWKKPLKWNKEAQAEGVRRRVFCSSLADVFEDWQGPIVNADGQVLCDVGDFNWRPESEINRSAFPGFNAADPEFKVTMRDVRLKLFHLIDNTPQLDWLLLTKRPENIRDMWMMWNGVFDRDEPEIENGWWRHNTWIGTSVSDQSTADKAIPELLKARDLAPVLFLSVEPLLGPLDLTQWLYDNCCSGVREHFNMDGEYIGSEACSCNGGPVPSPEIDWVIVGGESGPNARPCNPEWIRSIVSQCKQAGVPCFVKQMGANVVTRNDAIEDVFGNGFSGWPDPEVKFNIHGYREEYQGADCRIQLRDKKGGDPIEWPEDLRVLQFPLPNDQANWVTINGQWINRARE